jgi:Domain of unknown function (DUF4136)
MNRRIFLASVVCAGMLSIPAARAQDDLRADWNHSVDFSHFHSYSWGSIKVSNGFDADRIKQAVNGNLQTKGWQEVPNGGQVTIDVVDQIHNEQEAETFYAGLGGGWGGDWGWDRWSWSGSEPGGFGTATRTVPESHMVIDMFDSQSKKLLWRGISQREIQDNPDRNQKRIIDNIDRLLYSFPPEQKK